MDQNLERYLNDHLAGSAGAVLLLRHLIEKLDDAQAADFLEELRRDVEEDQELLEQMLVSAGLESSSLLKIVGGATARVGVFKLMWEGLEPGELGLFEALEMLSVGIQGKRLLWLALREIACWFPEWNHIDFTKLELEAIRQRDGVEIWRLETARKCLVSPERRMRVTV